MLFVDAAAPGVFYRLLRDILCSPVQLSVDTDALYPFPHSGFCVTLVDMTPAERDAFRAIFDAGGRLFGTRSYLLFTAHMSQCTLDDDIARLAATDAVDSSVAATLATVRANLAAAVHTLVLDNIARLWRRPWARRMLRVFRDVHWHRQHRGLLASFVAPSPSRGRGGRRDTAAGGGPTATERTLVAATKRECCARLLWAYQCQLQRLVADLEETTPEAWEESSRQSDANRHVALNLLRLMDSEAAGRVRAYAGWKVRRHRRQSPLGEEGKKEARET